MWLEDEEAVGIVGTGVAVARAPGELCIMRL